MFVSQEKNPCQKKFQKPNILRRKSRVSHVKSNKLEIKSQEDSSTYGVLNLPDVDTQKLQIENTPTDRHKKKNYTTKTVSIIKVKNDNEESILNKVDDCSTPELVHNNEENVSQNLVDVESFLNCREVIQNVNACDNTSSNELENLDETWCSQDIDGTETIVIECYEDSELNSCIDQKQEIIRMVPLSAVTSNYHQESTISQISDSNLKSEEVLKPVNVNSSDKVSNAVECPVRKIRPNGLEHPCGKIFMNDDELTKHLNDDHTHEDAPYKCMECDASFFFASGFREHKHRGGRGARPRSERPALACCWPGCGRVFRQPCRLREHQRAHTGDRPYPCRFPNCGWSFRSASKLVRHARRHTGERRHTCAACGRAFLRREHLRDHHARRHLPHARPTHPCTHRGCEQTFNNMSSMYLHVKKVHRKEGNEQKPPATYSSDTAVHFASETDTTKTNVDPQYMVSVAGVSPINEGVELNLHVEAADAGPVMDCGEVGEMGEVGEVGVEWHAARTHCTWPLSRHAPPEPDVPYVIEEDVQMEQSEGSESNIYTVRSDLFLHGNILTNDDSESMPTASSGGGVVGAGEEVAGGGLVLMSQPLDTELGLLDTHPTIDLMQEELMYTDAAVDESSFRIFLLSGEELS